LDNSIDIMQLVLFTLFGLYQFWAYKNNRTLIIKLAPMIFFVCFGLLLIGLSSFIGTIGYFIIIYVILLIELSLKGVLLVLILEIFLALKSKTNLKKILILVGILCLLTVVYYLGERIF